MFVLDEDGVYRCRAFSSLPWLEHGFGTRLSEEWLDGRRVASLRQVHSAKVWEVGGSWGILGDGDGLVTRTAGTMLGIRTADCLPILLVDVRNRAVAAIHAGWRGIVGDIGGSVIEEMANKYGTRRQDLLAAIGPGIGACCFEVGPEVSEQFRKIFPECGNLGTRTKLDLAEAAARQLKIGAVYRADLCTRCGAETFHSFRRDRENAGRMWSAAGLKDPPPARL